ncbi:methionine--tRNA ligase [Asanoa ishikariensis]|uniref:methionine--tRNA ligase n=1 Tax=Asanoa ishikariensis TaxID=137265 RepID=A0A1H3SAH9_9ACTN|nr:methionine--tRNA ligase [Asanoa ishikariensis]GIF70230.1 methionine--tRNA ligase [Asanoa ishikariensis]SDZ35002.1 methionyl-tRNA synthetase [Asanoa ishikariensis]
MERTAFISTTIPYVNARPHLGHALEFVETDAYARFMRTKLDDVFFLTGSDENALKNVLAAEAAKMSTADLVARNARAFQDLQSALRCVPDHFVRTSVDPLHLAGATAMWRRMEAAGDLYPRDYEGLYCVGCEQFYEPVELVDGRCPEHLTEPERVREQNWFFRLSRYQDDLLKSLESGALVIHPETRRNEVISFVRAGLADISVSRSATRARGWGIPVPGDDSQVMYVWIDALTNYTNALGWTADDPRYQRFWADATQRVHVMGKGVIRFHAVYWPAMLLSAGLPLPTDLVVHGYITAGGRKLGKSLGNAVDPDDLIARYGARAVRYALLATFAPFGDGDVTEERIVAAYNTDLANGLGNLVSRVTSMIGRYRGGVVPAGSLDGGLGPAVVTAARAIDSAMTGYDHRAAIQHLNTLVGQANAYVDEHAPWHLAKQAEEADRLDTCLLHTAAVVRALAALLRPFLPDAAEEILVTLGQPASYRLDPGTWLSGMAGTAVEKPAAIFPRIDTPAT